MFRVPLANVTAAPRSADCDTCFRASLFAGLLAVATAYQLTRPRPLFYIHRAFSH